jgi:WD40 repeat protein
VNKVQNYAVYAQGHIVFPSGQKVVVQKQGGGDKEKEEEGNGEELPASQFCYQLHQSDVLALASSSHLVASSCESKTILFDVSKREILTCIPFPSPSQTLSLSISQDETKLLILRKLISPIHPSYETTILSVYGIGKGSSSNLFTTELADQPPTTAQFLSHNGSSFLTVVAGSEASNAVQVWEESSHLPFHAQEGVFLVEGSKQVTAIAKGAHSTFFLGHANGHISQWEGRVQQKEVPTPHSGAVVAMHYDEQSQSILCVSKEGLLSSWSSDLTLLFEFSMLSTQLNDRRVVSVDKHGEKILISSQSGEVVELLKKEEGEEMFDHRILCHAHSMEPIASSKEEEEENIHCLATKPESSLFATGGSDGQVFIWDGSTNTLVY